MWAVIAAGIVFSLGLTSSISDEVFYVGDGGLRALMARQFASGRLVFYLDPPAEHWVHGLWDRGLYPFEPPFVYELRGRRYMVFPFVFPLLSAPFYAAMGFRGLYVVPLLALWATWIRFASVARAAGLSPRMTAASVAALVFASPLTLYGAIYWEHTLAVCLAFVGLGFVLPLDLAVSKPKTVLGGFLLSLSGLVREELFCLVGLVIGTVALSPWIGAARASGIHRRRAAALSGIGAGIVLFLVANWLVYRRPLGLHSILGLEDYRADSRVTFAIGLFSYLAPEFLRYCPPAVFAVFLVFMSGRARRHAVPAGGWVWLGIAVLFLVGVVALLPSTGGKQWSPRFLLILVPVACLLAGLALAALMGSSSRVVRVGAIVVFSGLCVIGAWRNTIQGSSDLRRIYQRRAVPLSHVRALPVRVVAVSHHFISQNAEALFAEKRLFLTKSARSLRMLAEALAARGETRLAFLCDPVYPCGPVTEATESVVLSQGGRPVLRLSKVEAVDRYVLYVGEVLPE